MRRFLTLISLLLCCLTACLAQDESRQYNLLMQIRGQEMTSICMMELADGQNIVGTVMNEFGVKAFDFTFNGKKAKICNVVGPLNKWYIRKILKADFSFILSNIRQGSDVTKKKRKLTFLPDGEIQFTNDRYNIHYTFTPLNSEHETD